MRGITVNPSAPPTDNALLRGDSVAVEQLVAGVLSRAHQTAMDRDAPDNARGVLYVAHCFADEFAAVNPRFDRLQFIRVATGS